MSLYNFALFQVAAKAIIKKDDQILLVLTANGHYDFPGGRMDESEVDKPLETVLYREAIEELGKDVNIEVNRIAFVCKRQLKRDGNITQILAVFYEADYKGGEISLSNEHSEYKWVDPRELLNSPDMFIEGDEFEEFKSYPSNT
jgi:8-oxo-dGTP diphosphatase